MNLSKIIEDRINESAGTQARQETDALDSLIRDELKKIGVANSFVRIDSFIDSVYEVRKTRLVNQQLAVIADRLMTSEAKDIQPENPTIEEAILTGIKSRLPESQFAANLLASRP